MGIEELTVFSDKLSKGALWGGVESSWQSNGRLRFVDVNMDV